MHLTFTDLDAGMGTELHHAVSQLHETLHNQKSNALRTSHYWSHPKKIDTKERTRTTIGQSQVTMDRFQEQFNRDTMRQTIIKQEELFREQVSSSTIISKILATNRFFINTNKQILTTRLSSDAGARTPPLVSSPEKTNG